jgi:hypothetical protein
VNSPVKLPTLGTGKLYNTSITSIVGVLRKLGTGTYTGLNRWVCMHDVSGASTHWNKKHEKLCRINQWLVSNWPSADFTRCRIDLSGRCRIFYRGYAYPFSRPSSPFSHPFSHFSHFASPFYLPSFFSPLFSFLPPLVFLPVSLYTVHPLITDAQTGPKKTIYKYIPQLRT